MWSSSDSFLYHDNALAHRALSVEQCLAKKKHMTVIPHPPY